MGYIKSILDTDLYKITMQNAILQLYPTTHVTYKFINRNTNMKFNGSSYNDIVTNIKEMENLVLTDEELNFLQDYKFLPIYYLHYLKNYRFKASQVSVKLIDGDLDISISGLWHETVLWEVPLMAIISESYFNNVDTNWKREDWEADQEYLAKEKGKYLSRMKDKFTDFGTRRRRSFEVQNIVVKELKNFDNFFGTSNMFLAMKHNLRAIGTVAHEFVQGISALEGLRYANKFALHKWQEIYNGSLGYALTDTFGTDAFFRDFDGSLSREYDGIRHDSGCPFSFTDKAIEHYKTMSIDPITKLIIFSDGLDCEKALAISNYCKGRIRCSFGIGTHLTNNFDSKPLNIVIKLNSVNGIPVVKLSDSPSKAIGDKDALRVAMWTFFNKPLD